MMEIRSMDEFERRYYPKDYERRRLAAMTPEEMGRWLAQQAIKAAIKTRTGRRK